MTKTGRVFLKTRGPRVRDEVMDAILLLCIAMLQLAQTLISLFIDALLLESVLWLI